MFVPTCSDVLRHVRNAAADTSGIREEHADCEADTILNTMIEKT